MPDHIPPKPVPQFPVPARWGRDALLLFALPPCCGVIVALGLMYLFRST